MAHIVMTVTVNVHGVMAHRIIACVDMVQRVMAYIVMIVMTRIVTVHTVMAHMVRAHMVFAYVAMPGNARPI